MCIIAVEMLRKTDNQITTTIFTPLCIEMGAGETPAHRLWDNPTKLSFLGTPTPKSFILFVVECARTYNIQILVDAVLVKNASEFLPIYFGFVSGEKCRSKAA